MKYIDAEQLRAEIAQLKEKYLVNRDKFKFADIAISFFFEGKVEICDKILSLIASLQQEQPECGSSEKPKNLLSEKQEQSEVDSEKEFLSWWKKTSPLARYFYRHGLNARKEK